MIHTDRVRHMVHLQAFNDQKGKEAFPVAKYFRGDFVGLQLLRAFISGTVCFGIGFLLWGICNMEELLASLHTMDLEQFAIDLVLSYAACMFFYLLAVYIYAQSKYARARKELKTYSRHLKRVIASFERDGGEE